MSFFNPFMAPVVQLPGPVAAAPSVPAVTGGGSTLWVDNLQRPRPGPEKPKVEVYVDPMAGMTVAEMIIYLQRVYGSNLEVKTREELEKLPKPTKNLVEKDVRATLAQISAQSLKGERDKEVAELMRSLRERDPTSVVTGEVRKQLAAVLSATQKNNADAEARLRELLRPYLKNLQEKND